MIKQEINNTALIHQKYESKMLLKAALPFVLESQDRVKIITVLSKIVYIHYIEKQSKQKKIYCIACKNIFPNSFLLILHLQLHHTQGKQLQYLTEKYQIQGDTLNIYLLKQTRHNQQATKFLIISGKQTYIFGSLKYRVNVILSQLFNKIIRKYQLQGQKKYFHSTNIFLPVGPQSQGQDSEDEIGKVQMELEKFRIGQFSDVNDNDKRFFTFWNEFMHRYRKTYEMIYPHYLKNLLLEFVKDLAQKQPRDLRTNFLMHLWALCSLGQVTPEQCLAVLQKYDEIKRHQLIQKQRAQEMQKQKKV